MGASQSSKSQLSAQRVSVGDSSMLEQTGGFGQPADKSAGRQRLGASLRKSVNNVLASGRSQLQKASPIKGRKVKAPAQYGSGEEPANGSLQNNTTGGGTNQILDSYYVSHRGSNNFSVNNYVTMQQQQARPMAPMVSSAASSVGSEAGAQLDQASSYDGNNRPNGVYGHHSKTSAAAAATAPAGGNGNNNKRNFYAPEPALDPATGSPAATNRDGSLNGGFVAASAQDTHGSHKPPPASLSGGDGNAASSRSSHQQQQQHEFQRKLHHQTPFQLSRAVNTKTSGALNNNNTGSTAAATNAVAMPKCHGRQKAQSSESHEHHHHRAASFGQRQHPATTISQTRAPTLHNNSFVAEPTLVATIGQIKTSAAPNNTQVSPQSHHQYNQQALHHQYHQQALPAEYRRPAAGPQQLYCYADDEAGENHHHHHPHQQQRFYARNLLDMDLNSLQQQQARYKNLQNQQYQYLNPNPYSAIDFHQATYNNNNHILSQHNHLSYQASSNLVGAKQAPLLLDCHPNNTSGYNYNRSYSFGSRSAQKKSLNPLVSMFQGSNAQVSTTNSNGKHSNTISLAKHRNNKSSLNINQAASSMNHRSFSGSLKRIKSAPLTAQQATYEAMRTIDMYLIRQIARSCMDFEMEQKIDLEIRLRELAAQSMLEARTEIDVLEVEKSLLTSDQRMNCYASQLEQQRKQLSNPSLSTDSGRGSKSGHRQRSDVVGGSTGEGVGGAGSGNGDTSSPSFSSLSNSQSPSKLSPVSGQSANSPSLNGSHSNNSKSGGYTRNRSSSSNTLKRAKNKKREQLMQSITSLSNINCHMAINNRASVSVSEIRIPLMWRDVDHFKGRGDYKRFAIFCLLKIGSQIYDTQLISDVDRQVTDVTFDDMVLFNEIEHNFELTLEIYSCVYLEQFSFSSTPRKLKEKLTSSVSRAMGRRLATQTASANYTKELQAYDKSYRFAMIASATLRLEDASDSVKTYDLVLVSPSAYHRNYPMYSQTQSHQSNQQTYQTTAQSMTLSNSKEANKNTLPLFGHFCCKLLVRPDVFDRGIKTGYLKVATINVPISDHHSAASDSNNTLASSNGSGCRDDGGGNSPSNTNGYDSTTTESSSTNKQLRMALAAASTKMATLSMSSSTVHWGLLRNFALHLWPIDEQRLDYSAIISGELPQLDNPRRPPVTLNIDKYTRLLRVSNSSLTLETGDYCLVLGTYCPDAGLINQADEISHWLRAIEQQIYDSHIWGSVLNHYPPHTKQQAADGANRMPAAQAMRNLNNQRSSRTATTYT